MDALSAPTARHAAALDGLRLARLVVSLGMVLLAVAGGFVSARRYVGALSMPLSTEMLFVVATCLAGAALLFRRLVERPADSPSGRNAYRALPSLAVGLWILGLTVPGTDLLGVGLLCGILLLEEGWSWGRVRSGVLPSSREAILARPREVNSPAASPAADSHDVSPVALESLAEELANETPDAEHDASTSQHLIRRREPSGEVIEGWARVDFVSGQRHAAAHLAICPPLERTPVCYAEQADGPPAQIKVTQAMTYGVRCEIKLDEPAEEPTSVVVEFSIQEPPADETPAADDTATD